MSGVSTPAPPVPTHLPANPPRAPGNPYRVNYGDVDVYGGSRATVAVGEHGAVAVGSGGGTVVSTDRGVAATGRHGTAVAGERGAAAKGVGGAAVVGEGGYGAVASQGDVYYGEVYEDYDEYAGQRVAAGVVVGVAIGTILATPPAGAAPITVGGSGYYYDDNAYYLPVYDEGDVAYQAVAAPVGAMVDELPSGCTSWTIGDVTYSQCGIVTYQHVPGGYLVVDS
jgi:hypothetical protein